MTNPTAMLFGTVAARLAPKEVNHISDAAFQVSSQWGEDGIIDWLIGRLPNPVPSFVEFGVEHYTEANTRFLLQHRNWRGLIADGSTEAITAIRQTDLMWRYDLTAVHRFIDPGNINGLFSENGFTGEIGLLSVDIDGQDYWVWKAIDVVKPQIVICEYNAVFGDLHAISVPSNPSFDRTAAHTSNLYWGSSIGAVEYLARSKGYTLVGSNLEGCNAFFVRDDLMTHYAVIKDRSAKPSLYRESRRPDSSLSYIRGRARADVIGSMPVCAVETGFEFPLRDLGDLYSEKWLRAMG